MKKILIIAAAFITLNSCKKDATFSEGGKQDNIMRNSKTSALTSALVTDEHFDFPGPFTLDNPCNGETVIVTGTIGEDRHTVINNNRVNLTSHQQGHLEGTGSLGNTYITNLNENVAFNGFLSSNGAFIINDVTIFRMISKGGAPDFIVRRIAHLTVNANGTVTVDRVDFETFCQG